MISWEFDYTEDNMICKLVPFFLYCIFFYNNVILFVE